MSEQLTLIPWEPITVHCFVPSCSFTVQLIDPDAAHARMEAHYTLAHDALINRLCGLLR